MRNTEHRTVTANIQRSSEWEKSKVSTETKETLTCRSCKECRGYKFCASRSRDYPCSCFIKNERSVTNAVKKLPDKKKTAQRY